jgi:hypothetical protein
MCEPCENPPEIVEKILALFDYYIGAIPSVQRQRHAVQKFRLIENALCAVCERGSVKFVRRFLEKYFTFFRNLFGSFWGSRPSFARALKAAMRSGRIEIVQMLFECDQLAYSLVPLEGDWDTQLSLEEKKEILHEAFADAYQARSYSMLKLICDQLELLPTSQSETNIEHSASAMRAYLSFFLTFSLLRAKCLQKIRLVLAMQPEFILAVVLAREKRRHPSKPPSVGTNETKDEKKPILKVSDLSTEELLDRLRVRVTSCTRSIPAPSESVKKLQAIMSAAFSNFNPELVNEPVSTGWTEFGLMLLSALTD